MIENALKEWETYRDSELARVTPIVQSLGYELDPQQVHTTGERYLQSGWKLVLTGTRTEDGTRVVIKASSRRAGIEELVHEHGRRTILDDLDFAYLPFHSPAELAFVRRNGTTLSITEFIEEETPFLAHQLQDQFFLALGAFKEQEGVHATTASHARAIKDAFGMRDAEFYLRDFDAFRAAIDAAASPSGSLDATLDRVSAQLKEHASVIDGYSGFLTHTDFVPHNFRVRGGILYLLDHTSLTFGNKYESWARFANYMTLYHPELERALVDYIRLNRSALEFLSFRLMRLYKLGFLLAFYAKNLTKTEGNLRELSEERMRFWEAAADAVLDDEQLSGETIVAYVSARDALRSEDEKQRQRALGQL